MINKIKNLFKSSKNEDFIQTFTKKWVSRLMWFAILSTSFTSALATIAIIKSLDYKIIASLTDLSKYGIYMIIGVMFIYMIKAFLGKYAEEKNNLIKLQSPNEWTSENESILDDDINDYDNTSSVDDEYEEED